MQKLSMDRDWCFRLGDVELPKEQGHTFTYMAAKAGGAIGGASASIDTDGWEMVDLPHDWAVYGEFDPKYGPAKGYKPRGVGWYVKRFRLDEADRNKQILIEFEGISTHSTVYCNGSVVARNFCGYTSFTADITDMAVYGEQINIISVFVDAEQIEGWWYEGAGIYRHVNMYKKEFVHIKHWGTWVNPQKIDDKKWCTHVETTVENSAYAKQDFEVISKIFDADGNMVASGSKYGVADSNDETVIKIDIDMENPKLWDIDEPNLYILKNELYIDGQLKDSAETKFGYRTIEMSCDDGFILNGRRVQLYGTCNHQDHAGVGVAVPDSVNEYRIKLLKEMGSNAYRCAHGNPTPVILDLCDKYGLLVMDENRNFSTAPEGVEQVRSMVLRDRNHPSVVMYSVFNEEPLQGTYTGRKLTKRLKDVIKKLDDTRFVVGAMNTGMTETNGAADVLDITGFNYVTHTFDDFREKFPKQPMIGSENNSAFTTRGVYESDTEKQVINSYDTEAAPWGNTHRDGFKQIDTRKHIMGMFIWTGFDYRGEPTPFEYPSISTQFGIMDTCGFKKDAFYLNKAYFTDEPVLHILPHWNHSNGDIVKVMPYTNCDEVELFLNGKSLGRNKIDKYDMTEWNVEYESGELYAVGYRNGEKVAETSVKTTGKPCRIKLECDRDFVWGECMDTLIVNVSVVDENGLEVPTADNEIHFSCEGAKLIGVGNGDPNSHESDKDSKRRLFNGLCQAIFEQTDGSKAIKVTAESDGLEKCEVVVSVRENDEKIEYVPSVKEKYILTWRTAVDLSEDCPDPNVVIEDHDMNTWGIVRVGTGFDTRFNDSTGFALYKTKADIADDGKDKVICFRDITCDNVQVFVDGEKKFEGMCKWGRKIDIALDKSVSGEVDLAVIIESSEKTTQAGITKGVVII